MYASESLYLSSTKVQSINRRWNSVYRKIFHYNKWESVSALILYLEILNYALMFELRKCKFITKLTYSNNFVIKSVLSFCMQTSEFCDCVTSAGLCIKMSVSSMKYCSMARLQVKSLYNN